MIWNVTHFFNTALQRFTCDLCFGAFLAPISVGIITGKHYTKNYGPKLNGTETVNQQKQETIRKQLRVEQGKRLVAHTGGPDAC